MHLTPGIPAGLPRLLQTRQSRLQGPFLGGTAVTGSHWESKQKPLLHPRSFSHIEQRHLPLRQGMEPSQCPSPPAKSWLTGDGGGWAEPPGEDFKSLFKNKQTKEIEWTKIGPNTCTILTAGKMHLLPEEGQETRLFRILHWNTAINA